MKIYNTINRKIEEFNPIEDKHVKLYTCGPTVYDSAHIGNLRTYLFEDFLKRSLLNFGYVVEHAMNITDVEDKTIKKSEGNKERLSELTKRVEKDFFEDLKKLNIIIPEKITRATEYIEQIVAFVESLIEKGFAYKAEDGSTYFSVVKFENYGKLSHLDKSGIQAGARVAQDEYDKENPADFALWKAWTPEDGEIFWETSLGKGHPGWHIECSTMAQDALGDTIDIHAGAVDLVFPHHENEIAQSEAKTGKEFSKYWVHGEHLMVDGKKMSKSLGNLYTLKDISGRGYSPLDFRYLVLSAHYRTKLNFTWDSLVAAKNARERLVRIISDLPEGKADENIVNQFMAKINFDLDTPGGIAVLWEYLRVDGGVANKATISEMDKILGLDLLTTKQILIPEEIITLAENRKQARIRKNFVRSDEIRDEITTKGYVIEDLPENEYKIDKV